MLIHEVYWRDTRKYVMAFILKCQVCQVNNNATTSPAGLLSPLPIPQNLWTDISLDFLKGLPALR